MRAGSSGTRGRRRRHEALYNQPYNSEAAYGPTYGLHREALELPMSAFKDARELAHKLGMDFIATAFDPEALDFILEARVDAIKVASGDLLNIPLQNDMGRTGLPVIVSCGGGAVDGEGR